MAGQQTAGRSSRSVDGAIERRASPGCGVPPGLRRSSEQSVGVPSVQSDARVGGGRSQLSGDQSRHISLPGSGDGFPPGRVRRFPSVAAVSGIAGRTRKRRQAGLCTRRRWTGIDRRQRGRRGAFVVGSCHAVAGSDVLRVRFGGLFERQARIPRGVALPRARRETGNTGCLHQLQSLDSAVLAGHAGVCRSA